MSCRVHYKNQIIDDIKNKAGVGRTSAVLLKPMQILLPIGGKNNNKTLKTKNNTFEWAIDIQETINKKYNSEAFGNLINIDNETNKKGTIINITIPSKLIDAYEIKHKNEEARNAQREDAKRAGIVYDDRYLFQKLTEAEKAKTIEQVTKEHRSIAALKDLSAKLAHRIGGKVEFKNRPDVDWKGYNQGITSVLNEAYMTPDTPFHEILAHPIIRAIKFKDDNTSIDKSKRFSDEYYDYFKQLQQEGKSIKEAEELTNKKFYIKENTLYQSLLKELETGRGKEVFDRVKRDYQYKTNNYKIEKNWDGKFLITNKSTPDKGYGIFNSIEEAQQELNKLDAYSLQEQQEEAIVELLGLMTADKLDAKKDATLISKLKELWKQVSDFVKSLLRQDGIKIDELPLSTTLNDLAEIMAYGNNKIILPGYKVEYNTPLGNKYDTLEEVNNEIRGLVDNVEVDLSGVKIENTEFKIPENIKNFYVVGIEYLKENGKWFVSFEGEREDLKEVSLKDATDAYKQSYLEKHGERIDRNTLKDFIEKNKEYEQAKEIIEQWKKENNIQYDPEEVYSRGQGFYSSIGAYSNLELDLLLKNLIQHIEDNKKAGGEFTISTFTKPIDKRLKHIEGTGDRVRFVIYPKSEHIKWAAPTDVYSGSVWDAHEKVTKDKKSELLGVSFTKAPSLRNINKVSPNLADIIDNLSHVHNELGIELTTNNFRIEYDDNIDYSTKKLIDNVNKILDDKYGKLEKPEIGVNEKINKQFDISDLQDLEEDFEDGKITEEQFEKFKKALKAYKNQPIQPTQTKENTTSIESVKTKLIGGVKYKGLDPDTLEEIFEKVPASEKEKEYTSQAEINLKIAALKEVARKYPRSLITSKVVPINPNMVNNSEIQYSKVNSNQTIQGKQFQKVPQKSSNDINKELENTLKEFAQINKIKIEFIDSLVEQFNGDYVAAYDAVNKVVYINKNKMDNSTLPEEIVHSLTLALGNEHTLVKKAFNLLSKTDYKSTLDPEYIKLYKGNENALRHEYLGKLIGEVLQDKFKPKNEPENKLLAAIKQLIAKFISLFNPNQRIKGELNEIAEQLAQKIINKEVVNLGNNQIDNPTYFQVDNNKSTSNKENRFKEQLVYFKQLLYKDINKLSNLDNESPEYNNLLEKITRLKSKIEELESTNDRQVIIDVGNQLFDGIDKLISDYNNNNNSVSTKDIANAQILIKKLDSIQGLRDRAINLTNDINQIVNELVTKEVLSRSSEEEELTQEDVLGQTTDVSGLYKKFGKLSNVKDYIARTISQMIKEVQTKVSRENKETLRRINSQVEKLRNWSKNSGISEKDMYEPFIDIYKGTKVLVRQFNIDFYNKIDEANKIQDIDLRFSTIRKFAKYDKSLRMFIPLDKKYLNDKYTKIQTTPELKEFYNFYRDEIQKANDKLPIKLGKEFIPNISTNSIIDIFSSDSSIKDKLKESLSNLTGINIKEFFNDGFISDETFQQDLIPLRFISPIEAKNKSSNLGDNLLKFINFANNYEQMSEILPTLRTMQGIIANKKYIDSNNPSSLKEGSKTNVYDFIETVIDMQVKGNNKKDEGKIKLGLKYDEEGNIIGERYVHTSKLVDFGLKYNSLLRIGLNPINAVTNVLIGDIGNIIEGFGNRFYSLGNLASASNIFFKDFLNKDSDFYKWREKIGPLQEFEDYESIEQVTSKRINKEKIANMMYAPQKYGESWLQNRTMLAILIKDGYLNSNGTNTKKGDNISPEELQRLTAKIYEVNNKIHGRYSQRDAATIQQTVLGRMLLQFKKWIPAALESRFESKKFNVDLNQEVEGRYIIGWFYLKNSLMLNFKAWQEKKLSPTELYNMKKNLSEVVLILATILMYGQLDDDEDKKNPYYKFTMDQLDRVSGDLLVFYNPESYTENVLKPVALAKTTWDIIGAIKALPHIIGDDKKDFYKSGPRKGENKAVAKIIDVTPVLAPTAKVVRTFKDQKYQKPNRNN